jgi:hypothetical protein
VMIYFDLSVDATLTLQIMQPKDGDRDSDVWATALTILTNNLGVVQQSTFSAPGAGATDGALGIDASVLGGVGPFRFSASAAQTTGATIRIAWRVARNRH